MEKYQVLIDIAILLVAILAYALCIRLYFKAKKQNKSKFTTEIVVIFLAIMVSTTIKALIFIFSSSSREFNDIFGSVVSALFSAIGGLQFEGLPMLGTELGNLNNTLKTLYYISSLWSGAVFLTIFSFAISVEFANVCKLRIALFFNRISKNKKSIYVFTSITEDALTLAHSIEEHHLDKKEKCIIIFSGNIGAFDKLNPLCVEIFSSGYIYNSVNVNNNHKTVLEILKLNNLPNVHLFAFALNEHMVADDEKNAGVVFSEIDHLIEKAVDVLIDDKNNEDFKELFNILITTYQLRKEKADKEKEKERLKLEIKTNKYKLKYHKELANANEKEILEHYNNNIEGLVKRIKEITNIVKEPLGKIKAKMHSLVEKKFVHHLEFYVLTKNETNIRAFEAGVNEYFNSLIKEKNLWVDIVNSLIQEYLDKLNDEEKEELNISSKNIINDLTGMFWNEFKVKFQINPVNEADLAAKDFCNQRLNHMIENEIYDFNNISDDMFKVLSLGFGEKGRAVMLKLFETSSVIDYFGNTLPFFANVYDGNVDNVSGTFLATHPMIVNCEEELVNDDEIMKKIFSEIRNEKIKEIYEETNSKLGNANSLPIIKFNNKLCLTTDFFKFIDSRTGEEAASDACSYDAIVIALGDDLSNIKVANSIIRDVASEFDKINNQASSSNFKIGKSYQYIGVNIRNGQNERQIDKELVNSCVFTSTSDSKSHKNLEVIYFGDAKKMYTYDNIISSFESKKYSYNYQIIYQKFDEQKDIETTNLKEFIENSIKIDKPEDEGETKLFHVIEGINNYRKKDQNKSNGEYVEKVIKQWHRDSLLSKSSTIAANDFKGMHYAFLKNQMNNRYGDQTLSYLMLACKLEHERWMRFHIANGLKFSYNHKKEMKKHHRMVSFEALPENNVIFDAINVAMAFINEDFKKNK